jgi:Putative DNA-binding domain
VWEYPWAVFSATIQTGAVISEWVHGLSATLEGREIVLPKPMDQLNWERRQSRSPSSFERLDWPVMETSVAFVDSQTEPNGPLVSGAGAPSFINLYTAAASFYYLDQQPVGGSLPQGVMYRHQDTRGRFTSVRISEEEVAVDVEGSAIGDMIVELAGDAPGPTHPVMGRGGQSVDTVRFPLEHGLPPGAWVLLRRDEEWIDRRFLTTPWARSPEAGVEFVVEPRTRLEAFLANGEGPQVEFKRQTPADNHAKANVMKTVCAFANGQGGSVLFGIDDDHSIVGVSSAAVGGLIDELTQTVGSWVEPRPTLSFETVPLDGNVGVVLEMRVEPGAGLHGSVRPGGVPTAYVRQFAITVGARPREIEEIVRARTPSAGALGRWGLS